jgi:4-amino-4-deoxy-L-arabinose transferase-like glycosyltransferase
LRLSGLGAEPLWLDEAFSWRWAHLPLADLWGPAAATETNPPLWFTLERLVLATLGDGEAMLRLPAASFGILAVPLAFLVGRALAGSRAGLAAAALVATDPLLVAYSQEARGYALLVAGTLLVFWAIATFFASGEGRRAADIAAGREGATSRLPPLVAYAVGAAAVLWAHNTGPLILLLVNLAAFVLWIEHRRGQIRPALAWLAANLVAALPWLVLWLPILLSQAADAVNVGWIRQPSPGAALLATGRLFGPHNLPLGPVVEAGIGFGLIGLAGWAVLRLGRPSLAAAAVAFGLPILAYLSGLVVRPIWIERALLPALAAGLVLAAIGLVRLLPGRLATVLITALLVIRLSDLAAWYAWPQKLSWPEAVEFVARESRPGDAVLIAPHFYHWLWAYYVARTDLSLPVSGVVVGPPPPPAAPRIEPVDRGFDLVEPGALEDRLAGCPRAWLIVYKRRGGEPGGILANLAALGRLEPRLRLEGAWDRGELEIFLWRRTDR